MKKSTFDLSGQTALVTGVSRGIGMAIAESLAEAGADVIGASASLEDSGSVVETRVRRSGRKFSARRLDLNDRHAVSTFAAELAATGPPIDILVNNAGVIKRAPALEQGDEFWDEVMEVDLTSQFILARALGASMLTRGRGKIVFIASILGLQGGINVASYAAAKSGILGLTRALSNEWAGSGINVNAIAPGYIRTDTTQALQDDAIRSRALLERIPAGRWGNPDDIGGAALFLASRASDYVCGAVLPVDGGWLAR